MDKNKISDFLNFCRENDVEFIDFRFSDIKGTWHHISYVFSTFDPETLEEGLPFDASSISGWQDIDKSDMLLKPDLVRYFLDPFTADVTVVVFCDIWDIYNDRFYDRCPRSIAKRAMAHLSGSGLGDHVFVGAENEFFIFDSVKIKDSINCQYHEIDSEEGEWNRDKSANDYVNIGHRSGKKGGYFPVPPVDSLMDIRAEITKVLNQVGLTTFVVHHEVAQGQCEIGVKYGNLLEAADNVQKLKYVVKMVAHLNGKTATFMPKPLFGDNGSGMHTHISIWKDGCNLFAKDGGDQISDFARHFLGGVLHHAPSVAAFSNASTNSYKRLIPGFEAPSILTYSANNRSASVRIPCNAKGAALRFEFRFPDNSANPYLAFSAILMAGIDGINKKIDPGAPMDINLFELSLDEIRSKGIRQLPHTLREAVECMLLDREYLKDGGIFSEEFLQIYKRFKFESEIWPWEARPHPFEFITTYSC
ncbi:MAG: type I glutamate--ammonia ligase [Helicobacter sp.]|nr:type I glutamate--ammonia ligase [Helicobacter sp.]